MMMISTKIFATVLHWPECQTGRLTLYNKSSSAQKIWLQTFDPTLKTETEVRLPPLQNIQVLIQHKNKTERNALLHFLNSKEFEIDFQCANKKYLATQIEGGVQTFRASDLPQQMIYLKNLFTAKNKFKIEILNRFRQPVLNLSVLLSSNEQRKIILPQTSELFYIRVSAENKFVAFNLNSVGSQNAMIVNPQVVVENKNGVYFELLPRQGVFGDSFTVLISDAKMIAKAREQISNPNLEKMLFAKIIKGSNNQNRNLASITKSFWNWSVAEVTNIADLGSTSCNGLPQAVDDRIDSWITDPGRICFWTYRIKREVPSLEISTGQKIN